jgi:hypothetical protein
MRYFSGASLLIGFILLIESPRDINKIWLRFALFLVVFKDSVVEIFEMINLNLPNFSNYGYDAGTIFKISFLMLAPIVAFLTKKWIMKILKYFSSA